MHTLIQEKKKKLMNRTIWKSRQGPLGIDFALASTSVFKYCPSHNRVIFALPCKVVNYRFEACNFFYKRNDKDILKLIFQNFKNIYLAEPMQKTCFGFCFKKKIGIDSISQKTLISICFCVSLERYCKKLIFGGESEH